MSDGGIGDAAHASRDSDHNPWVKDGGAGIVTARDFTHDPANGMDIDRLTDELAASRDPRIKYIIANGWILDSRPGNNPWRWVRYYGSNPHNKHFHLSVMSSKALYDDTRPWDLPSLKTGGGGAAPGKEPFMSDKAEAIVTENQRRIDWVTRVAEETQRRVSAVLSLIGKQNGVTADDIAEAMTPRMGALLLPAVEKAVTNALGSDNEDQARAIVAELTRTLAAGAEADK